MLKLFKWFFILNKRLYKKASFVSILVLLLISVMLFSFMAKKESGFVRVVLAQEDSSDETSNEIIKSLLDQDSMVLFTKAPSPDEAIEDIKSGKADSAWIFPKDMKKELSEFANSQNNSFVRVIEREQNVFLRLTREKLHAVLYDYSAKAFFINYTRENIKQLNNLSDKELLKYFDSTIINDELFVFGNPVSNNNKDSSNYLLAPIKGLLGLIIVLGGMAASLYFIQDEKNGIFSFVAHRKKLLIEAACVTVATLNLSVTSLIILLASGICDLSLGEIVAAFSYAFCCSAFCMVLRRLFGSVKLFASAIPALVIVIACVCPVFFTIKQVRPLSFLFPPTYYINVSHSNIYLLYMLLYFAVCFLISFIFSKFQKQIK